MRTTLYWSYERRMMMMRAVLSSNDTDAGAKPTIELSDPSTKSSTVATFALISATIELR